MGTFFRKSVDQHQYIGSFSLVDSQRLHFKENQISGVIEIQAAPDLMEVLVFGNGEETGSYRLWPEARSKVSPLEIGQGWEKPTVPIRAVALPDQASRALWQALEYQRFVHREIQGLADWERFLRTCHSERLTGMVGIASELCDGFIFLSEGSLVPKESIFCSSEGYFDSLEAAQAFLDVPQQLTLYEADPATEAYQCTFLRLGVGRWGKHILLNYKDFVGQKLLQILNASLNAILVHQQANIHLADVEIIDNHFFYESHLAAEAYLALFQDMSQLIGRVVGGLVTRRILSNTFGQLRVSEQKLLSTHTLTPASLM
jgi:hypothetical protein